jgi:hemolysin type calcium-binding protein/Big-like domain-containing protein
MDTVMINPNGVLTYTADLTPDNLDPNHASPNVGFVPKFANDIIYGGLGNDAIHGGAGDDAISGAEAPIESYANNYDANGNPLATDLRTDWYHPYNPGNVLGYSPTNTFQAQYSQSNPLRKILLVPGTGALYAGTIDTSTEALSENKAGLYHDWFLNFDANEGPIDTIWIVGQSTYSGVPTDGNDHIFGDLGNDWAVGGTGRDALYGGWGNDLLNADDNLNTVNGTNQGTDTNPSYEDLAYGGAGLDVLIANTGGDRLIDWGGEFNSYLTPFNPFGMPTVNRLLAPDLKNLVLGLSKSEGADQTLAAQHGSDPTRNGEPFGELGMVVQGDPTWNDQVGPPRDPQPGNGHAARDVLRTAGTLAFDDPPASASGAAPMLGSTADPAAVLTIGGNTVGGTTYTNNATLQLLLNFGLAAQMAFSINGGAFTTPQAYTGVATVTLGGFDGAYTVTAKAIDAYGNFETATQTVWLDRIAPVGKFVDQTSGLAVGTWTATTSQTQSLKLMFGDVGSGLSTMQFSTDGGATWTTPVAYSAAATVTLPSADGLYTLMVRVSDLAGNTATFSQAIRLDRSGPQITSSPVAAAYDLGSFSLTYGASDADGVSSVSAKVDGGTSISSGGSVNLYTLAAGTHTITLTAVDALGNVSTTTVSFQVHATIGGLINAVGYGGSTNQIQNSVQSSLLSTLNAAKSALAAGNTAAAKSYLTQFVAQVQQAGSNKIAPSYAALLVNWANDLYSRL